MSFFEMSNIYLTILFRNENIISIGRILDYSRVIYIKQGINKLPNII